MKIDFIPLRSLFSGLHVGSVLGLLLGPIVISRYGWQPLFFLFGALGLIWVAWFGTMMEQIALEDPQVALQMQVREALTA